VRKGADILPWPEPPFWRLPELTSWAIVCRLGGTGADVRPPLGRGRGARGDATFRSLMRYLGSQAGRPSIVCQTHGHVNVFKNEPRGDAARTVGGFDQIIAGLAAMFPAKRVDKKERLGELSSFD